MVTDPDNSALQISKQATDTILCYFHQCPILTTEIHFNIIPSPSWSHMPNLLKNIFSPKLGMPSLILYFRHMPIYSSNPRFRSNKHTIKGCKKGKAVPVTGCGGP
jgi:hypothetical protein